MAGVSREDIKKYRDKSYYILKTLDEWGHLAKPGTESNNLERVIRTNNNNFNVLDTAYFTHETIGKAAFWAIKITVDANYNTLKSWEARTVPRQSDDEDFLPEENESLEANDEVKFSEEENGNFFEVEEVISKGSTEEVDEKISDGSEFSFEIESGSDEIEKEDVSTGDDNWNVATTYYDNLESLLDKVNKLDAGVGESFKQQLIRSKEFGNAEEIADEFINDYLGKCLPDNLVELAKASMAHDRVFFEELLKAIRILGASSTDKILTKLAINHIEFARAHYDLHGFRALLPDGVETLEEEAKRLKEEEVKRFDIEAKRLKEEAEFKSLEEKLNSAWDLKAQLKKEEEAKSLKEEAEAKRLKEAEAKRLKEEAEAKRLLARREYEKKLAKSLKEEAEAKRFKEEAEAKEEVKRLQEREVEWQRQQNILNKKFK